MALEHSEDFFLRKLFEKAKIKEVMKTDFVKIHERDTLTQAEESFVKSGISHLLIVDKANKLSGLITPKYLYKAISPSKIPIHKAEGGINEDTQAIIDGDSYYTKADLEAVPVTSIMMKNPFSLSPDTTIGEGVLCMAKRNISCIPIVDRDNRVVGVFTNQEIVNFLMQVLTE